MFDKLAQSQCPLSEGKIGIYKVGLKSTLCTTQNSENVQPRSQFTAAELFVKEEIRIPFCRNFP